MAVIALTAKTINKHLSIGLLWLVLCGQSVAQSTTYMEEPSDTLTPAQPGNILLPYNRTIHGMGVASLSSYFPDSSYKEAYELAIEDLRANMMTSVYLESFKTTMLTRNREFAIPERIDTSRVVKIDSVAHQGIAYFFISLDSRQQLPQPNISIDPATWTASTFSPVQQGDFWIAAGHEDFSRYAPYASWAKSKLNALSHLSRTLQTRVQSSIQSYNAFSRELTYISSKTIFRNILVLDRTMKNGNCYTLVAVQQDNITHLD